MDDAVQKNEGEWERRRIAIDAEAETVREQGAQPGELRGHAIGLQSSNLHFSRAYSGGVGFNSEEIFLDVTFVRLHLYLRKGPSHEWCMISYTSHRDMVLSEVEL
ncbi:hypothetical protein OIU84_019126 [Salix udensis]|uniref:Uncharacterized protein n=1 Tax=Salix udensis TaxID=889485 RepID=A0AAD6KY45_9ROSI|nr:hypothetical protein OIU84_019126 [Salix udensis]